MGFNEIIYENQKLKNKLIKNKALPSAYEVNCCKCEKKAIYIWYSKINKAESLHDFKLVCKEHNYKLKVSECEIALEIYRYIENKEKASRKEVVDFIVRNEKVKYYKATAQNLVSLRLAWLIKAKLLISNKEKRITFYSKNPLQESKE